MDEMVEAFRSVLIVLPRGPTNDDNYARFIERTRTCSYNEPFFAPTPPFENMKVPASHMCTHRAPTVANFTETWQNSKIHNLIDFLQKFPTF